LHFGMFSFSQPGERQFGGVGAMIRTPGLHLRVSRADMFVAVGPLAERMGEFATLVGRAWGLPGPPLCRMEILGVPPQHVGLGTGTQLGLAVAAGLCALRELPTDDPIRLARLVGRGERSAIGTYGFARGGLLVEAGKSSPDELSPLVARQPLPAAWRFVLLKSRGEHGLSGDAERRAFAGLPPVPTAVTAELCRLALLGLVPAAMSGDFQAFSEALYDYGYLAGSCFAANQGGPFATPRLAELVATVRGMGVRGVGQSSWGPTLFALFPTESAAEEFFADFRRRASNANLELRIAAPDNQGARIVRCE
jgi:beta-RFAP synthase